MKQIAIYIAALTLVSCSNSNNNWQAKVAAQPQKQITLIRIDEPQNGTSITKGESVKISFKLVDPNITPDSAVLYINSKPVGHFEGTSATITTNNLKLGSTSIKATAWKNGQRQTSSVGILVKSDIVPKKLGYKIIKTYEHDPLAFTQGLLFHNGFLYEGTGQNGASSLRKVELNSGRVIQSINLDHKYFGEGIALLGNKIYQLTWTSGVGFTYDLNTLTKTGTFSYPTQGWGLTTNGCELIMSDGSNTVYFMEPANFNEIRRIEVYDNNEPIKMLNELEFIDGQIYANVFLTNNVVVIDPNTGAVTATIDLSNLLKEKQRKGNEDVLNGIAYDPQTNRIFVTGKYWGKLFQIQLQ